MLIRKAIEKDIDGILMIDQISVTDETRRQNIRTWVRDGCASIAIIDEQIVGYAVLEYTFFSCGFISMLFVQETYWRKGIATAIVKHLEKSCKTAKLFTSTNQSNDAMRSFLANMSYEPSGSVENLDEGDPELVYFKRV